MEVARAPINFAFAVIFLSLIGWWILRFFYRERLEALQHLIDLYKNKFGPLAVDAKELGTEHRIQPPFEIKATDQRPVCSNDAPSLTTLSITPPEG